MDFTHETPFAPSSLKQALQMAGFINVRVSGIGPVVHGFKSAVRFVLWRLAEAWLRFLQTVEGRRGLLRVHKILERAGGRILGTVLNKWDAQSEDVYGSHGCRGYYRSWDNSKNH